ncbi:Hint domain-containing protein [Shimia aestuarii]|uniref:Hint domain-containing protein n=1 Tax=Shimia aestuarii TaxID=254406 RepID=A0A1I4PHI1_9RHOB|nr:Hint domain-containing protein [Shimia aestuarii]SFM27124.1 Hint domain-containing protein [Shimia aestuarii]
MAVETVQVYRITGGDSTYPHSGTFTISDAGQILIDDSDGFRDSEFGDFTHTGGSDVPDQNVIASDVIGIGIGDTVDVRYKYTVTGSDGSSGTVYFLASNGQANYGPLIVSDFPLDPNVTYTFGTFNTDGAVAYDDLVVCFTTGTMIVTDMGQRPIETLREGDRVLTRDNGFQPLRWIGRKTIKPSRRTAPVLIGEDVLGTHGALLVSPNHRMLLRPPQSELFFQEPEVLIAAKGLLGMKGVRQVLEQSVTYVHILFDRHEIVFANGAPSESFLPGPQALDTLEEETRGEVLHLFPELGERESAFSHAARVCLKPHEADILRKLMVA